MTYFSSDTLLSLMGRPVSVVLRRSLKDVEEPFTVGAHLEYARGVPTPVAVVRRGPDGGQVVIKQRREALHAELMRAENVRHVVGFQELVHHSGAERVACAPGRRKEEEKKHIKYAQGVREWERAGMNGCQGICKKGSGH